MKTRKIASKSASFYLMLRGVEKDEINKKKKKLSLQTDKNSEI